MKQIIFILILFVAIFEVASGQILTKQGEKFEHTITLNSPINNKISFDLYFDNPVLIYIDSIKVNETKLNITKNNYILHCISDMIQVGSIDLVLFGTALYGNDTMTYIRFNDTKIDDMPINLDSIEVIVNSEYNHLYARLSKITKIYPLPANKWSGFEIEYVVDIVCDVDITIVNEIGQNILVLEYKSQPKGLYTIFIDSRNYSTGVYYAYFKTMAGEGVYSIIIKN